MSHPSDNAMLLPLPVEGWRLVTDGVMGGRSAGEVRFETHEEKPSICLRGDVRTDNNGGFIQVALDLDPAIAAVAADYAGVSLEVAGNGEPYNVHLRTSDLWMPWQSYRATFDATSDWRTLRLPFARFEPYKTGAALRPQNLRRIGIVAIGRAFAADICVAAVALYRERQ